MELCSPFQERPGSALLRGSGFVYSVTTRASARKRHRDLADET
jgi:hypothetical protein